MRVRQAITASLFLGVAACEQTNTALGKPLLFWMVDGDVTGAIPGLSKDQSKMLFGGEQLDMAVHECGVRRYIVEPQLHYHYVRVIDDRPADDLVRCVQSQVASSFSTGFATDDGEPDQAPFKKFHAPQN